MENLTLGWGMDPVWLVYYLLITFGAFVVASTLGIGGPLILIPALMIRMPPAQAVAVVAPIMLVNGLLKLWVFRECLDLRAAGLTCLSALPVALVAAAFTGRVDARLLRIGIGVIILVVLALRYGYQISPVVRERGLLGWGALIGAIGGFVGTAGPLLALSIHGYGLSRQRFVATVAAAQAAIQLVRLPTYLGTSTLPLGLLPLALLLATVAASAVFVARALLARMQVAQFQRLLDGFLLLIAVWLIGRAVTG